MPNTSSHPDGANRTPSSSPTPYPALNKLLADVVSRLKAQLGSNFVGAYLQGSFALGDFTESSDVDLVVAIDRDIADKDLPALQKLHGELHTSAPPWSQRLELSYIPKEVLRRWSPTLRDPPGAPPRPPTWKDPGTSGTPPHVYPLLFLGNGERQLVRSEHDNTRVVRWVTREKGIVLAGPDPRTLIEEVPADSLREEMRDTADKVAKVLTDPAAVKNRWLQAFFVTLGSRMLHTMETGAVASKKVASAWAAVSLPERWRPLIARAAETWRAPAAVGGAVPDPAELKETRAFFDFVHEKVSGASDHESTDDASRAKAIIERQLALKHQSGPGRGKPNWGTHGSGPHSHHGGAPPKPTRPGGRGRRG
jgi:hypothetical protein